MFNTIRQFVSLATYNADYDPEDEGASGNANIMEGVTTTNADIWPGGHGTAGWTNGSTVTVVCIHITSFTSLTNSSAHACSHARPSDWKMDV